jgi:hypothetical protein
MSHDLFFKATILENHAFDRMGVLQDVAEEEGDSRQNSLPIT